VRWGVVTAPPRSVGFVATPRSAVGFLIHAATIDSAAVGARRNLTMPGLSATVGEQIAALKQEAGKQLAIAADTIEKCGYHKRDEELAELRAVLKGEKTFAELPPRV